MPKSRGRKKHSKKKAQIKRSLSPSYNNRKELYPGIEVVQQGKIVFVNNNQTEEQHRSLLANLSAQRPEILKQINDKVDEVVKIFSKYDKVKLLGTLVFQQIENLRQKTGFEQSEAIVEHGLSFATAVEENSTEEPTEEVLKVLFHNLYLIRNLYNQYIMSEHTTGKYSDVESSIRFSTISETLFVRGDGYKQHIKEIYLELFSGHDDILLEHYGFNSTDIYETIAQLENSFFTRIAYSDGQPDPRSHLRFQGWAKEFEASGRPMERHFIEQFGIDNPDILIQDKKVTAYQIDDINSYGSLFEIRPRYTSHARVVEQLSMTWGENKAFLDPRFKGLPLTDSKIFKRPFIKADNKYYHFALALPFRSLIEITEDLIERADLEYFEKKYLGNKYALSRDNFLEVKTKSLFGKMLPTSILSDNMKYTTGEKDETGSLKIFELDLLVTTETSNYLVEAKAGSVSPAAKRGGLKSLASNLGEVVGYGTYQSDRAFKYIAESESPTFVAPDGSYIIVDKSKKTYRIVITLEHLAVGIASLHDLKQFGVIERDVDFAWVLSIYDLLVFSEILSSEKDLQDYLDIRIPLYSRPQFRINDEIDLLGHFLDEGLTFDEEIINKLHSFQLNMYSSEIDGFYERGESKPIRKL